MSEVVSRIPFERGSAKYKNDWHESQEEQVRPSFSHNFSLSNCCDLKSFC